MSIGGRNPLFRALILLVTGIVLSAAYVGVVNFAVNHEPIKPVVGWSDPQFAGRWVIASSNGTTGNVSISNGTLTVESPRNVSPGAEVSAKGFGLPRFDLTHYPFLSVSVRSLSVYLAVRIVLWTTPNQSLPIVVSTFNDRLWHTIYANLPFLGFSGQLQFYILEIGWVVIQHPISQGAIVEFQNLSLVAFSGG